MIQLGYILLGVGAYLVASEFKKPETDKGQSHEQNHIDQDGSGRNRRRAADSARETGSRLDRSGSVTDETVSQHGNGDVSGNRPGDNRGGESDSPAGHRETESVINLPTDESGSTHENEADSDHVRGNNGGDVRGESGSGDEPAGAEGA